MTPIATMAKRGTTPPDFSTTLGARLKDDDRLRSLLARRPDLATPAPRTVATLVQRAIEPGGAETGYFYLDGSAQQVAQALIVIGAPVTVERLAAILAPGIRVADLEGPLERLEAMALAAQHDGTVTLNPGAYRLPFRAGLGPPLAVGLSGQQAHALGETCKRLGLKAGSDRASSLRALDRFLADAANVRHVLETAPAGAVELARQAARGGVVTTPGGAYGLDDRSPAGWLARRGLLVMADWYRLVMPAVVSLALRGGHVFEGFTPDGPSVPATTVDPATVDAAGAEHALRTVADVSSMLEELAVRPGKLLKGGGLGVRDLRRVAKAANRPERDAARLLDIAVAAGLLWVDAKADAALPTETFDAWVRLEPVPRWAVVVAAWLAADFHPSLAGAIGTNEKPIPPLLPRGQQPDAIVHRRAVLDVLLGLPPGTAAPTAAIAARAEWAAPLLWDSGPGLPHTMAGWILDECDLLGLADARSLTTVGRHAAADDPVAATTALAERAPRTVDTLVFQADLTAVAAGALAPDLATEMELMADVESRGAATVYRFGEPSLRRAFDAGRSAAEIAAFLDRHAARGVPQALGYLVADVGRRHGQARVGPASSYVRSDDVALLAELAKARGTASLRFRRLAPTVLVSEAPPATVLAALRSAGYLPAEEDGAGALVVTRPPARRAPARPARRPQRPGRSAPPVDLDAVVAALRKAPPAPKAPAKPPAKPPAEAVPPRPAPPPAPHLFDDAPQRPSGIAKQRDAIRDLLDEAWEEDWAVRLSYANSKGGEQQLTVFVVDLLDTKALVEAVPSHHHQTLNLSRIDWARVLTEAEEDLIP